MRVEVVAWKAETDAAGGRARDLLALAELARTHLHDLAKPLRAEVLDLLKIRVTITGPPPPGRRDDAVATWFRSRTRPVPTLTDEAWARVEPVFSAATRRRRADALPHRQVLEAILYKAVHGTPWASLPAAFGPPSGLQTRFQRWMKGGTWARAMDVLADGEGQPLPAIRYPLPPMEISGIVIPRMLIGTDQSPGDIVPVGTVHSGAIRFHMTLAS
jgi:hypothetical protein